MLMGRRDSLNPRRTVLSRRCLQLDAFRCEDEQVVGTKLRPTLGRNERCGSPTGGENLFAPFCGLIILRGRK